jgi:hypothetical protein
MLARGAGAGRRDLGRHRHLHVRTRVRHELQPRLLDAEPVGDLRDRLAAQERDEDVQRLFHHVALAQGVDAHHEGIGGQRARPHAEHEAALQLVVELLDAVGQDERMVVGQRGHARA